MPYTRTSTHVQVFYNQASFPAGLGSWPLLRQVFLREQIQVVHAHAAFSTLGNDAMALAPAMWV
jgi:phosphatidylinositol glycan class A protein